MSAAVYLDGLSDGEARAALARCCGAGRWVELMLARRPFGADAALAAAADAAWERMERDDILEAFAHHPRIGADVAALRDRFAATAAWSAGEQRRVQAASEHTLQRLAAGNRVYEARFGYIFIVCASGKSADEMLAQLEARLGNEPGRELAIAASEQAAITKLRLAKLG